MQQMLGFMPQPTQQQYVRCILCSGVCSLSVTVDQVAVQPSGHTTWPRAVDVTGQQLIERQVLVDQAFDRELLSHPHENLTYIGHIHTPPASIWSQRQKLSQIRSQLGALLDQALPAQMLGTHHALHIKDACKGLVQRSAIATTCAERLTWASGWLTFNATHIVSPRCSQHNKAVLTLKPW